MPFVVVSTVVVVTHVRQSVLQYDRHDKANYRMMVILAVVLMAENVVCSGMIAGRLWLVQLNRHWKVRQLTMGHYFRYMGRLVSAGKTRFPYMSVIRAVLESAALYSVTFLILVVLTTTGYVRPRSDSPQTPLETNAPIQTTQYHAADIVLKALAILVGIVPTLMWFSSNFKIARDAGFAQPVTARGNISTDVEAAAGGGNSYAEWKFAPANGAIYSKLGTGHETITLPEPLFFGDQGACSACSGSSTARTLSPS